MQETTQFYLTNRQNQKKAIHNKLTCKFGKLRKNQRLLQTEPSDRFDLTIRKDRHLKQPLGQSLEIGLTKKFRDRCDSLKRRKPSITDDKPSSSKHLPKLTLFNILNKPIDFDFKNNTRYDARGSTQFQVGLESIRDRFITIDAETKPFASHIVLSKRKNLPKKLEINKQSIGTCRKFETLKTTQNKPYFQPTREHSQALRLIDSGEFDLRPWQQCQDFDFI